MDRIVDASDVFAVMRRTVSIKSVTSASLKSLTLNPWTMAFLYFRILVRFRYSSLEMTPLKIA